MKTQEIYDYIERISNLIRSDARRSGLEHQLQPIQLEALHFLAITNRYSDTPMAVTEYLGQTKGTVSQTLKVLESKGFISKLADKNDKRMTHLKITAAGKKVLASCIPPKQFIKAGKDLTKDSQAQILNALSTLLRTIQHTNKLKSFGVCKSCRYNKKNSDGSFLCKLTQEPLSKKEVQKICREHEYEFT